MKIKGQLAFPGAHEKFVLGMSQEQTCEFVQRLPLDAAFVRLDEEEGTLMRKECEVLDHYAGIGYAVNHLVHIWNKHTVQRMAGQVLAHEAELYVEQQDQ